MKKRQWIPGGHMPHSLIEHILSIIIVGFGWDLVNGAISQNYWISGSMSNKGRCTSSFNTNGLNTISFKQSRFNGSSANMSWRAEMKSPSSVKWLHGKTCPEHSVQYQGVSDKLIALNSSLEMGTHWIWYTESQSLHLSALLWVSTLCEQMLHFVNKVLFAIFDMRY